MVYMGADLSPLISRSRDSFPPRGSLPYAVRTWQTAVRAQQTKKAEKPVELQEQTGLCFLAYPTCYGKRKAFRKRLPLGGKLSRKRLMRGDKSLLT